MNDNAIKVMKLNVLDTHDRLLELRKTVPQVISQGFEDCLKKNPDSLFYQERSPYIYIFAHPRTEPDGSGKRMMWQPRLIKPLPETNSYCFRVISKTDTFEICWLLPAMEYWGQHRKGNVTENDVVEWSIVQYLHNRSELKKPHDKDMNEEKAKQILMELAAMKEEKARLAKLTI